MKKILSVMLAFTMLALTSIPAFPVSAASAVPKGFEKSVAEFADGIRVGWNLGNTLDVHDYKGYLGTSPTPERMETYWGNPKTTKAMFEKVKEAGFNAVRIPISWYNFTGAAPDYKIREDWMKRVQEVVDYAKELDLYIIINVHHDATIDANGKQVTWLSPLQENKAATIDRFGKLWTQIANRFKGYNEKLIFEGMNELFTPNAGSSYEQFVGNAQTRAVMNELNAEFVSSVRATGGNNTYRYLACTTHGAATLPEAFSGFQMPDDNRLMLAVHNYNKKAKEYEGYFKYLKTNFIDKGIPVYLGEWGSNVSEVINGNVITLAEREEHARDYTSVAAAYGIKTFVWDDGGRFLLLNRKDLTWKYPTIRDAIINPPAVHLWKSALNKYWQTADINYNPDGSMQVRWAGKAGLNGKQNQYASKFDFNANYANAAVRQAKQEGKTIQFRVKVVNAKDINGNQLPFLQVGLHGVFTADKVKIKPGSHHDFTIDVSAFDKTIKTDDTLQLLAQYYSGPDLYDAEIWVSPITVSQ